MVLAVAVFAVLFGLATPAVVKAGDVSVSLGAEPKKLSETAVGESDTIDFDGAGTFVIDADKTVKSLKCGGNGSVIISGDGTHTLYVTGDEDSHLEGFNFTLSGANIEFTGALLCNNAVINSGSIKAKIIKAESNNGTIEIKGGTVNAALAVDKESNYYQGTIEISGGVVNATNTDGPGISISNRDGIVEISGGEITVNGTDSGIYVQNGNVKITGGTVNATGGAGKPGIEIGTGTITVDEDNAEVVAKTKDSNGEKEYKKPEPEKHNIKVNIWPDEECGTVTGIPKDGKIVKGDKFTLTATANDGYSFDYWELTAGIDEKDCVIKDNTIHVIVNFEEDIEITAYFYSNMEESEEEDEWVIRFKKNGGKGEMDPQRVKKGETVKLNKNVFTRDGYTFKNWNTKADGSGSDYEDKASFKPAASLTLYAQWKKSDKHDDKDDDDDEVSHSSDGGNQPATVNPLALTMGNVTGLPYGSFIARSEQGPAAKAAFAAARPAGYVEGFTFNLITNGTANTTLKKGSFTMTIPAELRKSGRTFKIVALDKNGKPFVLPDTDNDPNTITVAFDIEGYAFDLIYKD